VFSSQRLPSPPWAFLPKAR